MRSPSSPVRVLFSSTLWTPFIEEDFRILQRHFQLEKMIARGAQALRQIPGGVRRSDVTLSWFGSVYAGYTVFLARRRKKKSIVIVAGVDASREDEIRYGIWRNPWKSRFVRYAFRNADRVLVVDPSLQRDAIRLAAYDGHNIENIPFGFDAHAWVPGEAKEDLVVTVASCENKWRMKKKGLDILFAAARLLPGMQFAVIGVHESYLPAIRSLLTENVQVIPYVPRESLLPFFQNAKVYCQPSYTEGLPNALCEAMLCGCIPVGTLRGGIPTAIGSTGYLVPYGDVPALEGALRDAMAQPVEKGLVARARIVTEFSIERREEALLRVIRELTD